MIAAHSFSLRRGAGAVALLASLPMVLLCLLHYQQQDHVSQVYERMRGESEFSRHLLGLYGAIQDASAAGKPAAQTRTRREMDTLLQLADDNDQRGRLSELEGFIEVWQEDRSAPSPTGRAGELETRIARTLSEIAEARRRALESDPALLPPLRPGAVLLIALYLPLFAALLLMQRHMRRTALSARETTRALQRAQGDFQALRAEKAYLRDVLDHVSDPVFIKDHAFRYLGGNAAFCGLVGVSESELAGKNDFDLFPPADAEIYRRQDIKVFATRKADQNLERLSVGGKTLIISTRKDCFEGPDGQPVLVGVIRDQTDLSRMHDQLRASGEARLKAVMEHSGRGVCIKEMGGAYLQVNSRFLAMLGETREAAVLGHCDYDFFPHEYASRFQLHAQKVAATRMPVECEEMVPQGGGLHTYTVVQFPMYDAQDIPYAICGIWTDITERKHVDARLARYMHDLERSNQELDEFAYIASHDLREPLRGLSSHAAFMLEDYADKLDEEGNRRLNRMTYLAQRMERLVSDLLYFARLSRAELAVCETDPNALVREIGQMMESSLAERGAELVIPERMPAIVCDRPRVTEVFRNLITNALKYNDSPHPRIEVGYRAKMGADHDVFHVRDNGIGIEPEFHQSIFRIFRRLHEQGEGTGVGLTFVKKIVERHKGRVWLESVPGKGSTFYFSLGRPEA